MTARGSFADSISAARRNWTPANARRIVVMKAQDLWVVLTRVRWVAPVRAESIKVAYSGVSVSGTPLWLAKDEVIFAKHGLDADLVTVRSAPIQVSALVSDEVQFVRGSVSS